MYTFDEFVLDPGTEELRKDGAPIALEPQLFRLLLFFVESEGRLVTRDELIAEIWKGRVVSDSAVSSRIKSLRKLLGDDGKQQRFLKTVPKRGFRFIASVQSGDSVPETSGQIAAVVRPTEIEGVPSKVAGARPSIAVLPFAALTDNADTRLIATAVPDDLITELARLRWLFIIARGSSFRFRSLEVDPKAIHQALGVRYCLSGSVESMGNQVALSIELMDLQSTSVVWGERYSGALEELPSLRDYIKQAVVANLEIEIPAHEAGLARLIEPGLRSTWANYHLGLQHLNQFTEPEIEKAIDCFSAALSAEPEFARAHSALSAAHFQIAFQRLAADRTEHRTLARAHAERGLALDGQDPFAHFVMGRVYWLEDDVGASNAWLRRAVDLSPNSAKSHYASAWSSFILGEHDESVDGINTALELSPLDPFRYGMLGVRSFNSMVTDDYASAARWGQEAAASPGAHALIALIAVAASDLAGDTQNAQRWAGRARMRHPEVSAALFFQAFPITNAALCKQLASSLERYGF